MMYQRDCTTLLSLFQLWTLISSVWGSATVLPNYSAHVNGCTGRRIATASVAGEVTMTSEYLPVTDVRIHQCQLVIAPKKLTDNFNRVMFYFSEFELGGYCKEMNLTVYDGDGEKTYIEGLGKVLCGRNSTVLGKVYTSTESEIHLHYRWSGSHFRPEGSFKMIFISFYDGPCQSEEGLFTCSENKRCISSSVSCRDDIDYCGNGTDPKCILTRARKTILQTLMTMARNLFTIVAICVGLSLLKKICYNRLKDKHGSVWNFPLIRKLFGQSNSRHERGRHASLSQNTNMHETEVISLTAQDISPLNNNNTVGTIVAPPAYEEVYRTGLNVSPPGYPPQEYSSSDPLGGALTSSSPHPPPPAYEDVVASTDRYLNK